MKAPKWYRAWRADAFDELQAKQAALSTEYRLGDWAHYEYDLDAAQLVFSDETGPRIRADVQVVGTTAVDDWMWAWANDHLPPALTLDAEQTRDFGRGNGIEELIVETLAASDLNFLGWELSAVAARVTGALGVYRAPGRLPGATFMLFRSLVWARPI